MRARERAARALDDGGLAPRTARAAARGAACHHRPPAQVDVGPPVGGREDDGAPAGTRLGCPVPARADHFTSQLFQRQSKGVHTIMLRELLPLVFLTSLVTAQTVGIPAVNDIEVSCPPSLPGLAGSG